MTSSISVKLDETAEARGSDLKDNDTWIRAAKDQKKNWRGDGNRATSDFFEGATTTTIQPKQLHTSHHIRPTTTHPRVDRSRTEAQEGPDASVFRADEGKQKQHAECVDNTAATPVVQALRHQPVLCARTRLGTEELEPLLN